MRRLTILSIFMLVSVASGLDLVDYTSCCHYCYGDGDLWVSISSPWNLTLDGIYVTDFSLPSRYFLHEEGNETYEVAAGRHVIQHAGAPIHIRYTDSNDILTILNSQYVEYDLMGMRDVTGVSIQGGYYQETEEEIMEEHQSWPTSFMMSYSTGSTADGPYTFVRSDSGNIEIFGGCTNARGAVLHTLSSHVQTGAIRIHPLGGDSIDGATSHIMMRVGVVYCMTGLCTTPRLNCELLEWESWSECVCDWEGCLHERERRVYNYEACSGSPCPEKWQREECTPDEPLWQILLKWLGLGLVLAIILIILIVCLYKRHQKKKQAVIFAKQGDERTFEKKRKKKEKKGKSRKKSVIEENEEVDETTEEVVSPKQVKVEKAESEPDLDKMYKTERDELVSGAPVPVTPEQTKPKKKKKAPASSDFNYINTVEEAPRDDARGAAGGDLGADMYSKSPLPGPAVSADPLPGKQDQADEPDPLMAELDAIGQDAGDAQQRTKKKKKKKKKAAVENQFGGEFVAGGAVDDLDDFGL